MPGKFKAYMARAAKRAEESQKKSSASDFVKKAPPSIYDDLEPQQSSGWRSGQFEGSRINNQVRGLDQLLMDNYFTPDGVRVEEDAFEGASEAGFDSEDDYGDDNPELLLKAQDDDAVGGYEMGRIDGGRVNVMDEGLVLFEDLADANLPSGDVVGEGSGSKESARAAALAGPSAEWASRRDQHQLPFSKGGLESSTRHRPTLTPEQVQARRGLNDARQRFNETAHESQKLLGPHHAGSAFAKPAPDQRLLRQGMGNLNWNWTKMQPRMGGGVGATAVGGDIMEATDEMESAPDEGLSGVDVNTNYFSPQEEAPAPPGYDQAAVDASRVGQGMLTLDQERQAKALRNPKKAKLYAKMAANAAKRARSDVESPRAPRANRGKGFFSTLGNAFSKGASVLGNALSSLGSGIMSMFRPRSAPVGAPTSSSFDPAEQASNARMVYGEENYERQQAEREEMQPDEREHLDHVNDPSNFMNRANMVALGMNPQERLGEDEAEQLRRMMTIDEDRYMPDEPGEGGAWYPDVVESRMNDNHVAEPNRNGTFFQEVSNVRMYENHFAEPPEAGARRARANLPSPQSYTDEQVDKEHINDLEKRVGRYQNEAFQYVEGDGGGIMGSSGMTKEERGLIKNEFFRNFRTDSRLSFGPYARNRQQDAWDAELEGSPNPLYPKAETEPDQDGGWYPGIVDESRMNHSYVADPGPVSGTQSVSQPPALTAKQEADEQKRQAKQEAAEQKRQAALAKKYPRLFKDQHQDDKEYFDYYKTITAKAREFNVDLPPLDPLDYLGREHRADPEFAQSQPNGIVNSQRGYFYPEEMPEGEREGPQVDAQVSGESNQNAFQFSEGEAFAGNVSMNILEDYVPPNAVPGGMEPLHPAPQVAVPDIPANPSAGVINLPRNAGKKAKVVGPQPTKADKKEAARLLAANSSKAQENAANNAKASYKAKKLFGMVKDQRIDPQYEGRSQQEAEQMVMEERIAGEERRKAAKKKKR